MEREFTVRTDNNHLTYIMSSGHLDATRHRWVGNLASYTFNIEYKKGKHNVVADTLSRYISMEDAALESKIIQSVCQAYGIWKLRTTPYHPQGNGPVERFHQTMTHMIGKLDPEEKADW